MRLAQKRYGRLECVHGVNKQRMHGTISVRKTHDLELRSLSYDRKVRRWGLLRRSLCPWKDSWYLFPKTVIVIWESHARTKTDSIFLGMSHGYTTQAGREFQSSPIDLNSLRLICELSFKFRSAGSPKYLLTRSLFNLRQQRAEFSCTNEFFSDINIKCTGVPETRWRCDGSC